MRSSVLLPRSNTTQRLLGLASGKAGVRETLSYMRRFADEYKIHPTVRELALKLTRNLPQKDYGGEQRALWSYVKNSIRYVRDIHGVETVQSPLKTLEYGAGDCDDKSTLLAALLESLGHTTRFAALGFKPGQLCHVLVESKLGDRWVPLETTEPVELGWSPPRIVERIYDRHGDLSGNIFSNIWGGIKKVGRTTDTAVVRKATAPLKPVARSKAVQIAASILGPALAPVTGGASLAVEAGIHAAGAATAYHDAKGKQEKAKKAALKQQGLNDAAATEYAKTYVYDPALGQIRLATDAQSDAALAQYRLSPQTGKFEQVSGTKTPGLTTEQTARYKGKTALNLNTLIPVALVGVIVLVALSRRS